MSTTQDTVVVIRPMYLDRPGIAAYTSLGESTWDALVARGEAPKPRMLTSKRSAWLVEEVEAWCRARPVSSLLPPKNSGYGRAGKPA